mmetsp:Transcript_44853/g.129616  ORF Transcript_44853/g.129616 Transcript_44853/m.129616 type:complete len:244 (-) Transcript_44853:15-746(-)
MGLRERPDLRASVDGVPCARRRRASPIGHPRAGICASEKKTASVAARPTPSSRAPHEVLQQGVADGQPQPVHRRPRPALPRLKGELLSVRSRNEAHSIAPLPAVQKRSRARRRCHPARTHFCPRDLHRRYGHKVPLRLRACAALRPLCRGCAVRLSARRRRHGCRQRSGTWSGDLRSRAELVNIPLGNDGGRTPRTGGSSRLRTRRRTPHRAPHATLRCVASVASVAASGAHPVTRGRQEADE